MNTKLFQKRAKVYGGGRWMAVLLASVAVSSVLACKGPPGAAGVPGDLGPDFPDYLVDLRDTIVFIDLPFSQGSGVRISSNEILTAQHVVGTRCSINVSVKGEGLVFATVIGHDSWRDVALLTFDNSYSGPVTEIPESFLVLEDSGWRLVEGLGHQVVVVAYTPTISKTTPIATFGRIGVIWSIVPGKISKGQIDAAVTSGMSGGGGLNKYGELIGILLSTTPTFDWSVGYLSYSEIN